MIAPLWHRALDREARRAFWSSYAGFSIDAMSVQLYAFILPGLMVIWGMTPGKAGVLASAALLSGAFGGWIAGSVSDRIGRIRVLQLSILWLGVASALCGFAQTYDQFLAARLIQGFGFGAEWAVGVVFMSEMSPSATRGRTLGTLQSAWAVGWALAAATATLCLALLPPEYGWRVVFVIGLLPALILARLRSRMRDSTIYSATTERLPWHRIFAPDTISATLRGSMLATGTHGGYWAIATWWPTMLRVERGMSATQTTIHTAFLIGGSFIGYLLGAWLSDRIGRRATLGSFAAAGATTALLATQLPITDTALLALTPVLGLFALGIYSAIGPVLTELYPTPLRGSGMGFCYNVGRGLAGVTPLAVGGSVATLGYAHAIGLYVAVSYILIVIATMLLRETRGIQLAADVEPDRSLDDHATAAAPVQVKSPAL